MPIPVPAGVAWTRVAGGPWWQTFLGLTVATESVVADHLFSGHLHDEGVVAVVVSGAQATTSDATHMAFPDATSAAGASAAAPDGSRRGRFVDRRRNASNGCRGWFSRLFSKFRFRSALLDFLKHGGQWFVKRHVQRYRRSRNNDGEVNGGGSPKVVDAAFAVHVGVVAMSKTLFKHINVVGFGIKHDLVTSAMVFELCYRAGCLRFRPEAQ